VHILKNNKETHLEDDLEMNAQVNKSTCSCLVTRMRDIHNKRTSNKSFENVAGVK
jgi:hypothetical protein